mmetsp:Transcript_5360/g.13065  ORF Transcript_5360/g.13065 Transcript_5360/m.13065 type:complete len:683 (-) Transcript_5360:227-2275(-)
MDPDAEGKLLQEAATFWKDYNLRRKSNEIDSQVLKIYDKEQASSENRKKLAKITKELGTLKPAEKLKSIRGVIRAYQKEIDQLTKRATFSENAFIAVYKGLCDAPDPAKHLGSALLNLRKLRKYEKEMANIQGKLRRYEEEFKGLKNQEVTVKTLKEQNQEFLRKMEELREGAKAREQHLVAKESESLKTKLAQQEQEYMARLEAAQGALARLTMSQQQLQAKLYDATSKEDAIEEVGVTQTEMLLQELEAANLMISTLKGDKERLEGKLKVYQNDSSKVYSGSSTPPGKSNKDVGEIKRLRAQLSAERNDHKSKTEDLTKSLEEAKKGLEAKTKEVSQLKGDIAKLPSREAHRRLKRRVILIQEMGFNVIDPDIDGKEIAAGEGLSDTDMSDRTAEELMILQEARRLKAQITKNKVGWAECKEQLDTVTEELNETKKSLEEHKLLVGKLEDDLASAAQATPRKAQPRRSSTTRLGGDSSKESAVDVENVNNDNDPDSQILSSALRGRELKNATNDSDNASKIEEDDGTDQDAMLKIISCQRDRFRQRIQQLESEQITAHNMRKELQQQLRKLRAENITLYEKLQYVSSYRSSNTSHSGKSVDSEKKDSTNNPYQLFRQKQRQAHFESLSTQEKLVHRFWEFLFSKNSHRTLLFGYALFLHFLVFLTLWRHTHIPPCPPNGK